MKFPEQPAKQGYSIGVVTYHARYDAYFVPLIKRLVSIFPDREILCVINGHPDRTLQISYLNKVTQFLNQFPNVRYLTYDENQSLSKCWNQLIILSRTEKVLVMNDDTQVTELFRQEFEKEAAMLPFSTLNESWSHFLFSKSIIKKVGWFDERLLGVGNEDADYALRMTVAGLPMTNTVCLGLNNYAADEENPGWKDVSKKVSVNKYAQQNQDFFKTKWQTIDLNPEIKPEDFAYKMEWHGRPFSFSALTSELTPQFYDYSCLDFQASSEVAHHGSTKNPAERQARAGQFFSKKIKIFFQNVFYRGRGLLKKIYVLFLPRRR